MKKAADPIKFRLTSELIERFANHRVFFSRNKYLRLKPGDIISSSLNSIIEPYVRYSAGRNVWSMGSFSYSRSELPIGTIVGRYCSLASGITVIQRNHPIDRISTSPFTYDTAPFDEALIDFRRPEFVVARRAPSPKMPVINHDVWVGSDVKLARGISIGCGAIVAAGSVVTRDIPAYEIWGGVPARIIRSRFPQEIKEKLLAISFWRFAFPDFHGVDWNDSIETVISRVERMISNKELIPFNPPSITMSTFYQKYIVPSQAN